MIATYPKCGTTWMQRIVALLVFQDPAPLPVMESRRGSTAGSASRSKMLATIEAQDHRRFLKAHLPADGLPLHDEVSYIHVARDGRDACLSYHNHLHGFTPAMLDELDRGRPGRRGDRAPVSRACPPIPADFFHRWVTEGAVPGDDDGLPQMSYFHFERSWWDERQRPNVLLVHYADMKADLGGEMRRVADFLGISVPAALWPALVEAAGFDAMRRAGDTLMGRARAIFRDGAATFFHRGETGRWRGIFRDDDLALYAAKCARLPPGCARWLEVGSVGG